jgi:hypothetical protein
MGHAHVRFKKYGDRALLLLTYRFFVDGDFRPFAAFVEGLLCPSVLMAKNDLLTLLP